MEEKYDSYPKPFKLEKKYVKRFDFVTKIKLDKLVNETR